jgi:hypothetical protein
LTFSGNSRRKAADSPFSSLRTCAPDNRTERDAARTSPFAAIDGIDPHLSLEHMQFHSVATGLQIDTERGAEIDDPLVRVTTVNPRPSGDLISKNARP